jgi:microcystin-dependent protein
MAGSISLSLSQQFDSLGKPLNGGQLFTYAAGTTTPQSAYQDTGLTIPWPNPITLDAAGRVPAFYLADGSIKVRLTDSKGVVQINADNLLVIGPSSGGGGGGGVDATTILQTGQLVHWYGTGNQTGFVRCNGRSIGSSTSGATERANADTQALFTFLWNNDGSLAVSGGRGVSPAADWAANKNIALPDFRGRVLAGLDDMGNSAAGRLTATYFGSLGTTLGVANGSESHTLTTAELASHAHAITDPGHNHTGGASFPGGGTTIPGGTGGPQLNTPNTGNSTTGITINNAGGGGAHANVQPTALITIYQKL